MKMYAEFDVSGRVFSVSESDVKPNGSRIVEAPGYQVINKIWNGNAFVEPAAQAVPTNYARFISVACYLKRFTLAELSVIDLSSIDDPSATAEVRLKQATIRQLIKMLDRETEIYLDDSDFQAATIATCELLKAAHVIENAQQRFAELVNTPVNVSEAPARLQAYYPQI